MGGFFYKLVYMKSSNKNEKIQSKIENFCLYQERCKKEVITKLKSLGVEKKMIEKIVLNLLNQDLLNEIRYSKNYSRGKFRIKKWGRLKIYQELKKRNISEFNIKIGLKEIEENYVSTCEELVKKIEETSDKTQRDILYSLMSQQMSNINLAESKQEYAIKVLDPSFPPEERSHPRRTRIVLFWTFIGFAFSLIVSFLMDQIRSKKPQ